jgi:LuxR family maltose regulon positive regulatory protein
MPAAILATKLYMPPRRHELVGRAELTKRLTEGLARRMSLISAPAGYGKTTLVAEWLHGLRARSAETEAPRIAWLSLDPADSDPVRFMMHMIAALREAAASDKPVGAEAEALLHSLEPRATEPLLVSLINDLTAIRLRTVLVLDDYHFINSAEVDKIVSFFVEHLPASLHLVVATRSDPSLHLARLRVRGELTEIRAGDLRFSVSEAAEFLNEVMKLDLATERVAALERRTEGWIAGLQLAALSLKDSDEVEAFVTSFTGSHRHVMDFLVEEVLDKQPEGVRTFLLQTSILERMTGPLCDAVTGRDGGQEMLEALERSNLFVVSLDHERRWYRYHHLFARLLRHRLVQAPGSAEGSDGGITALHARASAWFERQGCLDQAIEHALAGEQPGRAAVMIEALFESDWANGDARCLRWLNRLDGKETERRPFLCILRTCLQCITGEAEAVVAESLESAKQAVAAAADRQAALRGRLAAVRALIESYRSNWDGIRRHAEEALAVLTAEDSMWRALVAILLGDALMLAGDMGAAHKACSEAARWYEAVRSPYYELVVNLLLANTLRQRGMLGQTVELCRGLIERADRSGMAESALAGWAAAMLGEALAEMNLLEEALPMAEKGVRLTFKSHNVAYAGWASGSLVRVLYSSGKLAEAQEEIGKITGLGRRAALPSYAGAIIGNWQIRIWLAGGKVQAARDLLTERGVLANGAAASPARFDFFTLKNYLMAARFLLASSRPDEAIPLLGRLRSEAENCDQIANLIEIELLQALALQAMDETDQALETLTRALSRAEACGFVRIFLDEGPPLARLLYEAAARGGATDTVRGLIAAFPPAESAEAERPQIEAANAGLFEPLSDRELDVLRLIAEGSSNQEIADRLFISLHTVKSHARSLFAKLEVSNRTGAVNKARGLGLLPTL